MINATRLARPASRFRNAVLAGLSPPRKRLPARYFYDAAGSRLFDEITALPEYYLTRTELGILHRHAGEIARRCGPRCLLIELGAGSLSKGNAAGPCHPARWRSFRGECAVDPARERVQEDRARKKACSMCAASL